MKPTSTHTARTGILTLTAALLGTVLLTPQARAEEVVKTFTVSGRAQVHVDTNDGSVKLVTGDSKQVEFHVQYQGYELDKDLRVDAKQNGDTVELTARLGNHWGISWGHSSRSLSIEVRMPRNADAQINTGDGSVESSALEGNLKIHTGDGSVRTAQVSGSLDIDTGDGSITVEGAKGSIRLRTGDGHIEARGLDGTLEATSGDGHITIAGRFDGLSLKTGDGSINAQANPGSKLASSWSVHTGDGSVDFALPGDLQADIDASTRDGHISMGIPVTVDGTFSKSQIHGKMNGGGQALSITTGDGSIRLSKT
jgi:Putative adhesin